MEYNPIIEVNNHNMIFIVYKRLVKNDSPLAMLFTLADLFKIDPMLR